MLPSHYFKSARRFSSKRSTLYYFHVVYGLSACAVVFGFSFYQQQLVNPEARDARRKHIVSFTDQKPEFTGAVRPTEAAAVKSAAETSPLVVFAPRLWGKTYLMQYINSSIKSSFLLEIQDTWLNTMNFYKFEDKFEEPQFNEFMGIIEFALLRHKKPIFLIDGLERLSDIYRKRVLEALKYWIDKDYMSLVITTSSQEVYNHCKVYLNVSVYLLPRMNQQEFHKALSGLEGYDFNEVEALFEACGADLEYALELIEGKGRVEEFLQKKKIEIKLHVEKWREDKKIMEGLSKALSSINEEKPLGDAFAGTKAARALITCGLAVEYIGSIEFRNKFVVKSIKLALQT